MEYIPTAIEGVYMIRPRVFADARGYFMEAFKQEEFDANVYPVHVDLWCVTWPALSEG